MSLTFLQTLAKSALEQSDVTVIRHLEKGETVPADFTAWRKALLAIYNGTDTTSTTLPIMPDDYVAGT